MTESIKKRENYISWDEYFMGIALLSGMRSKDPATQVGACIVNENNKIVGIGYNGLPLGCSDDEFPWGKDGDFLETKYPYTCHAELNAILNSLGRSLEGCKIFTTLFPCNECAKAIIQSGIREVIYLSDKYSNSSTNIASKFLFDKSRVKIRQMVTNRESLHISFNPIKI